jgi:hypothetical protein
MYKLSAKLPAKLRQCKRTLMQSYIVNKTTSGLNVTWTILALLVFDFAGDSKVGFEYSTPHWPNFAFQIQNLKTTCAQLSDLKASLQKHFYQFFSKLFSLQCHLTRSCNSCAKCLGQSLWSTVMAAWLKFLYILSFILHF